MGRTTLKLCVAVPFIIALCLYIQTLHKSSMLSDIVLANLEALADDEDGEDGFEQKVTETWQEGPYKSGEQIYYYVYSVTTCLGIGLVDCQADASTEIVYK